MEELLLLEELLFSPTRDCDISLFCCSLEGGRSYVDGLEDGLLSRVRSVDRVLEAERLKKAELEFVSPFYWREPGLIDSSGLLYRLD